MVGEAEVEADPVVQSIHQQTVVSDDRSYTPVIDGLGERVNECA